MTVTLTRKLVKSHGVVFVLGLAVLCWLTFPLSHGQWRFDSSIHWDWLLIPALLLAVVGGGCQGVTAGFGRFWPTVLFLVPTSLTALWVTGLYVAPTLFGSIPEQPTPDLLIAAVSGWVLYTLFSLLVSLTGACAVSARRSARLRADSSDEGATPRS